MVVIFIVFETLPEDVSRGGIFASCPAEGRAGLLELSGPPRATPPDAAGRSVAAAEPACDGRAA
jgi:hypothetical protein